MSAARATMFALIAMSTALPSNKIRMAAPESNRPKGQLPRHSNTRGHFWLSPEGHNERKTRLKVLTKYCTTAGLCRRAKVYAAFTAPSANRQFSKPERNFGLQTARPQRPPWTGMGLHLHF